MNLEEKRSQEKLVEDRIIEILKKSETPLTFVAIRDELKAQYNDVISRIKPERLEEYLGIIIVGLVDENQLWTENGTYDYHTKGNRAKGKVEASVVDGLVQCYVEFKGKKVPIDINNSCDKVFDNDEVFYVVNDGKAQVLKVIKPATIEGIVDKKIAPKDSKGFYKYRITSWREGCYRFQLVAKSDVFLKQGTKVILGSVSKGGKGYRGVVIGKVADFETMKYELPKETEKSNEEIVHGRNK